MFEGVTDSLFVTPGESLSFTDENHAIAGGRDPAIQ